MEHLQGLLSGPEKVLILLVDANHPPIDNGMVTFVMPEKTAAKKVSDGRNPLKRRDHVNRDLVFTHYAP